MDDLVKRLELFAVRFSETDTLNHFNIFYRGFSEGTQPVKFTLSKRYPPEYALHTIIAQILYDLETINWAATQRSLWPDDLKKGLDTADALARRALKPAIDGRLVPDTPVVTYFQKSANIRVTPYADVALIGIPLTAVGVPRDYLAIPHEVGHYVFHHGKVDVGGTQEYILDILKSKFETDPNLEDSPCRDWIDEIFADVYGCLCAGPVIALDCQDIQLENCQDHFVKDDGEHPVPCLRPDIYHQVLRSSDLPWPDWAGILEDIWEDRQSLLAAPHQIDGLDPVRRDLETAVRCTLELALHTDKFVPHRWCTALPPGRSEERQMAEEIAALEKLYVDFGGQIEALIAAYKAGPQVRAAPADDLWQRWVRERFFDGGPLPEQIPVQDWLEILIASGWITKGNGRWKK
ncbi:MAG: hypothetical protein JXA93_21680 [Anaerolineae bacterium]|nr:hypothetical protein [Anaerolineae bacterium]